MNNEKTKIVKQITAFFLIYAIQHGPCKNILYGT